VAPSADHDRAQHDHAQDAPEQHPVLVLPRDGEEAEDQRDDEDVVHRQRLLDHEAGVVVHAALRAQVPPHPGAEQQRHADVAGRQQQALAHADLVVVLVQHAQVEGQQRDHDADEGQPDPGWLAHEVGCEEGGDEVHGVRGDGCCGVVGSGQRQAAARHDAAMAGSVGMEGAFEQTRLPRT
jgi:hypothetical protein